MGWGGNSGLGTRDSGLGTRDSGLGTRDSGLGTRDSGLGTRDSGLGTRDSGRQDDVPGHLDVKRFDAKRADFFKKKAFFAAPAQLLFL
ncbi:hypothetical protein [Xanthomonas translucens]|uniref:hypothetical protein n=1 Tax=Xanthomonas campestris pv. translucens TaxID=343 RepID=UPI0019D4FF76|nr:hypothetical protein [Xanthomonas translucens]QSQ56547.1 hypothetical protein ISN37_00125 [Xanthomonas translucens pv. undulosa]